MSPSSGHEVNSDTPVSQGVVQISATDYDDIASNYPRARLTYMDYDDGDQITVSIYPKYSLVFRQMAKHACIGRVFSRAF